MPVTYPPAAPTISGDNITISAFLKSPTQIARRIIELTNNRYVADVLLSGRFNAAGGAVQYISTGESQFAADDPKAIAPGGEYPQTTLGSGTPSVANVVKVGRDALITDEAIARMNMFAVNREIDRLVNTMVKYIDGVALSAISSAVTQNTGATAAWSTAGTTALSILLDIELAKANLLALNNGYDPNVVVCSDIAYAHAYGKFLAAGFLPRESENPIQSGAYFTSVDGMTFLRTGNLPVANAAMVADTRYLGGMADEDLGGPGYVAAGFAQAKTIREDNSDQYRIRVRRTTVPVVLEAAAGWKITGVTS